MLTDPQSVTIAGTTTSLPRTSSGVNQAAYTSADGTVVLTISHTYGKRTRRTARLDFSKIAADPLISANNIKYSMSAYFVLDLPLTGFTPTEAAATLEGLIAALTASSDAMIVAITGGQS
jgi:hypothetical protein